MMTDERTDYLVINRVGTVVSTAGTKDLAQRRARELAHGMGWEVRVERVTTTISRETVYRPRVAA